MAQPLSTFLYNLTGGNAYLATFLVSMFPLIELKGAIPIGTYYGLDLLTCAGISYLGSSLIVIPIFFLLIPIFNLLKKIKFIKVVVEKIETVFKNKAEKLAQKSQGETADKVAKILAWALFIFVAVPFPVTGAWTGTGIAVFLNMKFKDSVLPITLGNLVAGTIITLLTWLFKPYVDIIITVLFIIALIMLTLFIIKVIKSKPNKN